MPAKSEKKAKAPTKQKPARRKITKGGDVSFADFYGLYTAGKWHELKGDGIRIDILNLKDLSNPITNENLTVKYRLSSGTDWPGCIKQFVLYLSPDLNPDWKSESKCIWNICLGKGKEEVKEGEVTFDLSKYSKDYRRTLKIQIARPLQYTVIDALKEIENKLGELKKKNDRNEYGGSKTVLAWKLN